MARLLGIITATAIVSGALGAYAMSAYDHRKPPSTHIAAVCDARGNLVYTTPDGRLFVLRGC